eukprot:gene7640-15640_t
MNDIPRFPWDSVDALDRIKAGLPVLLQNCPLVQAAVDRWTFEHLASIIPDSFMCDVYCVDCDENASPIYHYWDTSKNLNGYEFNPPTTKLSLSFREFLVRSMSPSSENGKFAQLYLQQSVVQEMGQTLLDEYMRFSLETAVKFKQAGNWDAMTTNLLLCGPPGAITTSHFDEQQNLFAQLWGRKRVRLHPPSDWTRMYPYPLGHPRDRQAQVTLPSDTSPNSLQDTHFPEFPHATEFRVDMSAGDVLYIPQYWWHQMEALTQNVSLSWWFKDNGASKNLSMPLDLSTLTDSTMIAIRRNIERILSEAAGGKQGAHEFFLAVAGGRITIPLPPNSTPLPPLLPNDVAAASLLEINPSWSDIVKQSLQLLELVIPREKVPYFFLELVAGRFSNIH